MKLVRILLLLATVLTGCSQVEGRTQLTFRLDADEPFRTRIETLNVTIRSDQTGTQSRTFTDLAWPVDIVVVPELGNDSKYGVRIYADALDASGNRISQIIETTRFYPERENLVSLRLSETNVFTDPATDDTPIPSDPDDDDDDDKPRPDAGSIDGGKDASTPTSNCKTTGEPCEDGNKCNGIQECSPGAPGADARGCVTTTPAPTCSAGMNCDPKVGECTSCRANADADGDKVDSMACGGKDCDDSDKTVNPSAFEVCDGKDNNCDGEIDEDNSRLCPAAPMGQAARCLPTGCVNECAGTTVPQMQADGGVACVVPVDPCAAKPCGVGECKPAPDGYTCTCPATARAGIGNKSCAPTSTMYKQSFEAGCDDVAFTGFVGDRKTIEPGVFSKCGIAGITHGTGSALVELVKPPPSVVGTTGATALYGGSGLGSEVTITFTHPVGTFSLEVLNVDAQPTVKTAPPTTLTNTLTGKKSVVSYSGATGVTAVTITNTALIAIPIVNPGWFVDNLQFPSKGCGDGVRDATAGEQCDIGPTGEPCKSGCDFGCKLTTAPCYIKAMNICAMGSPTGACPAM